MKKLLILLVMVGLPAGAFAAGGHKSCGTVECDAVDIDLGDKASLQRGARIFVNYCLSCHSAGYMRYNRMGRDLGISDELIKENLLFAADKVGDLMKAVMPKEDARLWFGVAPPDLSLIARARKPAWVYTYLRSFYRDSKSPSGWNNTVFAHVAMPHVLYEWQGDRRAVFKKDAHGVEVFERFELQRVGSMDKQAYDRAMRDLTNFLTYLGEPARLVRYEIGIYVLIFLAVFLVFAYLLKKEYWKDIH
ncbi:MAG: cytochrome C [Candidatus Muproteobacteria bacterium RIFCSPHIGHO2_12_FULL_60_33]|uniref:Cytochrome C n=1 Tax=Candidatus Muproteobacteria bacterium RIFCSPLOWO2_01_FULL_60_18 TaxID=1817768 RepID=A0A1F6U050_9PROT|nr:MAG: cytochrome C [Candidatus Muproteobacteria bacterium RIFCSPHIGHO2_01_60_12]OGI50709.1 MAG: cytochrome C [Candidatus Muproteobacteria bacterium RIFCSPLOWO2_01_FULL_60_18]OGI54975.1 MAG: cytochrome C [Candidatus Muproteobacteria bacterium RIFCSPHIGHO2_12_FULL_60_33]OGI58448.1 MAG: cytochrome C [Candidatus Muproteobacteria bacterium RIFCSPHIGHO2_01_FULL_61_200]